MSAVVPAVGREARVVETVSGSDPGPHRSRHGVVGFGVANDFDIELNAVVRDHGPLRLSISFEVHDMMISE